MKGFKDSTKTVRGHHNAPHPSQWLSNESHVAKLGHGGMVRERPPEVDLNHSSTRDNGRADVDRSIPTTQELEEHGGRSPLTSGFAKGGKAEKHFHVHNHYHGGKKMPKHHERKRAEKHAMKEGGHVHDDTSIPKGSPDYKKGGKVHADAAQDRKLIKEMMHKEKMHKNAGGAVYQTGGTVDKLATGGVRDKLAFGGQPMQARPQAVGNVPMMGNRPPMPSVGRGAGAGRRLAPAPVRPGGMPQMASKGGSAHRGLPRAAKRG